MVLTERMGFLNLSKARKEAFFLGREWNFLSLCVGRGYIHGKNIFE